MLWLHPQRQAGRYRRPASWRTPLACAGIAGRRKTGRAGAWHVAGSTPAAAARLDCGPVSFQGEVHRTSPARRPQREADPCGRV